MQKPKPFRSKDRPWRNLPRGASADFARDMAKAEFGRHYVSEKDLEEVRRSLTRAKAQRAPVVAPSRKSKKKQG